MSRPGDRSAPGMTPYLEQAEATDATVSLNGRDWRSDQRTVNTSSFYVSRPAHILFDTLWDAAAVAVPLAEAIGLTDGQAVQRGLDAFRHPLRGERLGGVTFDACHNEEGIRGFARWRMQPPQCRAARRLIERDWAVLEPFLRPGGAGTLSPLITQKRRAPMISQSRLQPAANRLNADARAGLLCLSAGLVARRINCSPSVDLREARCVTGSRRRP